MVTVQRASKEDIDLIVPLFDAYRVFYEQESNREKARDFLNKRLQNKESIIFFAMDGNTPVGFTQLYTTFSSVSLEPMYILNDLYVSKNVRGNGIGEALLKKAKEECIKMGFKGLALETGNENPAQQLYERLGWKKDTDHLYYFWSNPKK